MTPKSPNSFWLASAPPSPAAKQAEVKIVLSEEQEAARRDIKAGRNVLITGQAGTGKSTLLKLIRDDYGDKLAVTASTGIAALNVGGTTIHTFAGLGLAKIAARTIASFILGNKGRPYSNIMRCKVLALDEVSMISADLFAKIDEVFQIVRRCEEPFGGVQLVALGDFHQLPPVSKQGEEPALFAFESEAWARAGIHVHVLSRVYRQSDQAFADALSRLRVGDIHHPSISLIAPRCNAPLPTDGIRPTVMHTHNADVDALNLVELAKLPVKEHSFHAHDHGKQVFKDRLDRDCLAPKELKLKLDAQVMLLANVDIEAGLVNGRMGVVTKLGPGSVKVRWANGQETEVDKHKWDILDGTEVLATREQYPLRLGWAITAHKSQGMTLDRIVCHLGKTFEYGQAYVAVSRVRTLEGLFLRATTRQNFRAHPKALAFYAQAISRPVVEVARQEELGFGMT